MPNEQYAIMPLSDYEDACDSIRAKTGGSALIKSGDMASEIDSIQTGGGVITETVDYTVDNRKLTSITIPVTSTNYDNIIVSYAIIETGKYVDGSLVVDETPTIPTTSNDGFDFVGGVAKLANGIKFSGFTGTVERTNYAAAFRGGGAIRTSSTPTSVGGMASFTHTENSITVSSVRAFCQIGYYNKFRFKIYFWND